MIRKRSRRSRRRPLPLLSRDVPNLTQSNNGLQDSAQVGPSQVASPSTIDDAVNQPDLDSDHNGLDAENGTRTTDVVVQMREDAGVAGVPHKSVMGGRAGTETENEHDHQVDIGLEISPSASDSSEDDSSSSASDSSDGDVFEQFLPYLSHDCFTDDQENDDESNSPADVDPILEEIETLEPMEADNDRSLTTQQHFNDNENMEKAARILTSVKRFMSRPILLGAISLYGKVRYTLEHYDHLVEMMKDGESGTRLPSSVTMRKSVFPQMIKTILVQSSIQQFKTKASFTPYLSMTSTLGNRQKEAVVVLPSAWARMDIRSLHVIRELACIEKCRCDRHTSSSDLRMDTTRYVTKRAEVVRNNDSLDNPKPRGSLAETFFKGFSNNFRNAQRKDTMSEFEVEE